MDVVFIYGVIIEPLRKNSKDWSRRVGWQSDKPACTEAGQLVGLPRKVKVDISVQL